MSTSELLAFQLAHAQARDAVWRAWDAEACAAALEEEGISAVIVQSRAEDRATYLKRPDLGRRLDAASTERLAGEQAHAEVALILSDGLSAAAVDAHGVSTLRAIRSALAAAAVSCSAAVLARFGRVALSDEIGHALGARISVIVIGERPGLSAADSLGIYLTHSPAPATATRNETVFPTCVTPAAFRLRSLPRDSSTCCAAH